MSRTKNKPEFDLCLFRLTVRGKSTLRKRVLPLTSGTMPKTQRTGNLLFVVAFMYGTKGVTCQRCHLTM